ncbi:Kalirin [Holothuria leucospilota]|uniref:Kalirin n=1 Tax=Holothuria leucospilota TaxID=206669 RepID=A0A9Q1CP12_HOLLE|nr:Kalirin [Holothuria leucospilota]
MDDEERRKCVMMSRDQTAPKMPDDQLISSEVAIYTGGRDQEGRPIISFPSRHHKTLESKVKASGLDHILRYYAELTSPRDKTHGLAFVADLRFSTFEFVSLLKSALNSLQGDIQGFAGKGVLYAIQPQNKKVLKDVMTVLALRTSKKKKNKSLACPLFQTVLVPDETDLHNYIDQSQLLAELGGYLQYSHTAWVRFRKTVEPFFVRFSECSSKFPAALDSVARLEELQLGHSQSELERSLQEVKRCYEDAISECNLPSACEQCTDLLHKLKHSEDDPIFNEVAQKAVFKDTFNHVRDCQASLNDMRDRIETVWKKAEERVTQSLSAIEYSARLKQLVRWFTKDSKNLLRSREIGETPGRAEALKNHFETSELPLAEEKLANAEQLVEQIQAMVVTVPLEGAVDVKNQARKLLKILKEFRKRLNEKEDFVLAVCDYYTLYDEIDRWCMKVLKFLPANLDKIHELLSSNHLSRKSSLVVEWRENLRRFLRRRPAPDDDDIINLEQAVKLIGDEDIKRRSLELIDRFDVLVSVLSSKRPALRSEVQQALKWRLEFLEENDYVDSDRLSHASSYLENRSVSGHEDTGEVVDPLMQRLMASGTFDPNLYEGGDFKRYSDVGSQANENELDDVRSGGSTHRSGYDDRISNSSRSQASSQGRISSKDYYSGKIPSRDHLYTPKKGQRSHHEIPHHQASHPHPSQSLLRQNLMLSASQPHLPTNMDPYRYPYMSHNGGYSPYSINNQFVQGGGSGKPTLSPHCNNSESYIPLLSDIEGNSDSVEVNGQGDGTQYVTAYYTPNGQSSLYTSAVQSQLHSGHASMQAMHMQNFMNNHDGSYIATQSGGPDLSPGQVTSIPFGHGQFQTSTPRSMAPPFYPSSQHQLQPRLPFGSYQTVKSGEYHSEHSQINTSPYNDVIDGIHEMKFKSQYYQPSNIAKSTPDLRRLSAYDMNIDPELVASELDSDEQVEYYKRVCGFLKNLPTKKRKPRRLRNRQGKSEDSPAEKEHGRLFLDKASEYSRSTASLFDNSVNEDMSFENHSFLESPRVKTSHPEKEKAPSDDMAHTLTTQELPVSNSNKKVISPLTDRPPTGLSHTLSPSRRRNLIPDGTPPIAPLTDSLRRFLEDTERDHGSPSRQQKIWEREVLETGGDEADEDLRRYEELLSQREEDLEAMSLPEGADIDDEDLMEHEAFLTQVAEIEQEQERTRQEANQIAAENNIKIGQADDLLHKLSQADVPGEGAPSIHLSDEGAFLDGMSMEDAGEHGSSITTERESVESGVGMHYRYQAKV